MNKIELKDILVLEGVRDGIASNLNCDCLEVIEDVIAKSVKDGKNNISIIMETDGDFYDFDNTLYKDEEKGLFLLESRLFSREDESMTGAYLEVLDSNLNEIEEYIDDVWEYADWVEVE